MHPQDPEPDSPPESVPAGAEGWTIAVDGASSGPVRNARVPTIEGYEIVRELGRGGMGVVYEARQLKLNRTVALKMVLAGEHAGERMVARFLAEAKIAAGLQHPNIVQIHELGEAMGLPFIAMELAGGCSMAERVKSFGNDFRAIAGFFERLARATQWAHQHSVIHRDLKPANVLIGPDGEPKIADFGLAKRLDNDPDAPALTRSGEQMGTPAYMAPEQAFPEMGEVGSAADTYSLGVMLYEVLTGKVPFRGSSHGEVLAKLHSEDPSSPAWLRTGLPRDLETICMKCLRKDPRDRYATAGELADDLMRFRNDDPIQAKPASSLTKTFRWARRHRLSMGVAATIMAAGAVAAAVWARQHHLWKQEQDLHVTEFTESFANFARAHGQYVGVGPPLSAEERAHRPVSYQIVRAGREGRCVRLSLVDSAGRPAWLWASPDLLVPGLLDGVTRHRLPSVFEFRYQADGLVSEERLFDSGGQLVTRLRYTYPDGFDPREPQTGFIQADFVDESSKPVETVTGLSSVQIQRDKNGRERRMLYADAKGSPKKDKFGAGGIEIEYTAAGQAETITLLDENGNPAPNSAGKAVVKLAWNDRGGLVSNGFFDLKGQPTLVDGIHLIRSEFDRWGNVTVSRFFGTDGVTPARYYGQGSIGATEFRWVADDRGLPLELTSSGFDFEEMGFASLVTRYRWAEDGAAVTELTGLDSDGKSTRVNIGWVTLREEIDSRGRSIRLTGEGYDPDDTGYFIEAETTEWNPQGDKLRSTIVFRDEMNKPAFDLSSGAGERVKEYGPGGLLLRETFGNFQSTGHDRIVVENKFDEPEPTGRSRFPGLVAAEGGGGSDDVGQSEPLNIPSGSAVAVRRASATPGQLQAAIRSTSAKLITKTGRFLGRNGEPVPSPAGNTLWVRDYHPDGRINTETHTGFDPAKYPYARITITTVWKKDSAGRTVDWEYFTAEGKPARSKEGYSKYSEDYDADGHLVRIVKSGYDETEVPYAAEHSEQSGWEGDIYRRRYWFYTNAAGERVRYSDGYMDYTEEYDAKGAQSMITTTGYDRATVPFFRRIARRMPGTTADSYVLLIHWEDEAGQPVRGWLGELESREEYSRSSRQLIGTDSMGFDESKRGFVAASVQFGDSGKVESVRYTDSRGQPVTGIRPYIRSVVPGSVAAGLKFQPGDILVAYNGRELASSHEFISGTDLTGGTIDILRNGKPLAISNVPPGKIGVYLGDTALPK